MLRSDDRASGENMQITIGTVEIILPDTLTTQQFTEFLQALFAMQDDQATFVQKVTGQAPAVTTAPATQTQAAAVAPSVAPSII